MVTTEKMREKMSQPHVCRSPKALVYGSVPPEKNGAVFSALQNPWRPSTTQFDEIISNWSHLHAGNVEAFSASSFSGRCHSWYRLEYLATINNIRRKEVVIHHVSRRCLKDLQLMKAAEEVSKGDVEFTVCKPEMEARSAGTWSYPLQDIWHLWSRPR